VIIYRIGRYVKRFIENSARLDGERHELKALIAGCLDQVDVRCDYIHLTLKPLLQAAGNDIRVILDVTYHPRMACRLPRTRRADYSGA
jgi:hypothetical protein